MKKFMKSVCAMALALAYCTSTIFANGTNETVVNLADMESAVLDIGQVVMDDNLNRAKTTTSVSWNVSANALKRASTTFPMAVGETVTINCTYSPKSADVDFGLIDSNNRFYYIGGSQGSINCTITIEKRGDYRFAVCNNSSNTVSVSGFIEY